MNAITQGEITLAGLHWLRDKVLKAGSFAELSLPGVRGDRVPVLPGGLAIMLTIFEDLEVERMAVADTALRDGVLYDLMGRKQHADIRESSVAAMMRRYHVDFAQADRVTQLALAFFDQATSTLDAPRDQDNDARQQLEWAARLHETGAAIAQAAFHKHSAYIVGNADLPGFSKREQAALATLLLAQRGKLSKVADELRRDGGIGLQVLCLRLAVLLARSRRSVLPKLFSLAQINGVWRLRCDNEWIADHSLTEFELAEEAKEWVGVGAGLEILGPAERQ